MYPVPALAAQIERGWAEELAEHFGRKTEEVLQPVRPWLAFPAGTLRLQLMDGSFVEFKYAFHVVSESKRAIAVFTEHCGHHVFPYHDAKVFRDGALVYEQPA